MSRLDSRYRGTVAYHEVYKLLVKAVHADKLITFEPLIHAMGLPPGNYAQSEVARLLSEISEDTRRLGLPMLGAVAVNSQTNQPAASFFDTAVRLGRIQAGLAENKRIEFWQAELERVFAAKWPGSAPNFSLTG